MDCYKRIRNLDDVKKVLSTTMAIANRAVSADTIGSGVFTSTAKSFDLATRKKNSHKMQKLWLRAWRKGRFVSPALLAIAETL